MRLTTLAHRIDMAWMKAAFDRTRKNGATGVDGQTAEDFAASLEVNLRSLLDQAKNGTYKAPPVRRAYIPKGNGEQRPLGIPTFADKVLQRAVICRKTAANRLSRSLVAIRTWCRRNRHQPVAEQHQQLCRKLQGHYGYYGITGNYRALSLFFEQAKRAWHKWLSRRSQKAYLNWTQFQSLLARYRLPHPRIIHSAFCCRANP